MGKRCSAVASRKCPASALVSIPAAPAYHCRFMLLWLPGGEGLRCGCDGRVDLEVDDFDRFHHAVIREYLSGDGVLSEYCLCSDASQRFRNRRERRPHLRHWKRSLRQFSGDHGPTSGTVLCRCFVALCCVVSSVFGCAPKTNSRKSK